LYGRVQDLRKTAELDISDRIILYVAATDNLKAAIQVFKPYIQGETLATELSFTPAPPEMVIISDEFDGERVSIGLKKV